MLKIYTVGSRTILGTIEGRNITGIVGGGKVDRNAFAAYLKADAVGELTKTNVGEGHDVITDELSQEQLLILETVKSEYKAAKKMAKGYLVNMVFDNTFSGK